ncbi:DUF559 domain-containing protein [Acidothermaceae bacterium B102]|nr:DUF559 domain-containing protein [Acidothermaceae bacterium B102]
MLPELKAVAANNGGVFTRTQALKAGYTEREVRTLVESRLWTKLRHGIYVDSVLLISVDSSERALFDIAAARLCLNRPSAGSHVSAAQAYGLPRMDTSDAVHLTSDEWQRRGTRSSPILVHRGLLPEAQQCLKQGVALTSPARTVLDVASILALPEAVAVADAAVHAGLTTRSELLATLEAVGGPALARAVVEATNGQSESVLESVSRVVLIALGIEMPIPQYLVRDEDGKVIARVDFWWPQYRVAGEADGLLKYDSDPAALRREKLRQEALERQRIRVVRWTWDEITKTPLIVVQRILTAFQLAGR